MKLLKEEFESDGGFPPKHYTKEDIKRVTKCAIKGYDGKKVTLDNEHMKEIFSKYEILKEWKD